MRFRFIWLIILCFITSSYGSLKSINADTHRKFDQGKLEAYKLDPDFKYIDQSKVTHWWSSFYNWLSKTLSKWLEDKSPEEIGTLINITLQVIAWTLFLFALGMVVYSLYKKGVFGVIAKKKQSIDFSVSDLESKVLETNWQELINKAITGQQYNVAIRLLFLQLLQSLNTINQIKWAKSKSIRDYQRELTLPYQQGFSSLARYYQYSWFGDIEIDESHFNEIYKEFRAFETNVEQV